MKKALLIVLVALLICVSAVFAQEETVELNPLTVGELFTWGDKAEDVYNFLSNFDGGEITIDTDENGNGLIQAVYNLGEEIDLYGFYFTPDAEELWEVETFLTFTDTYDPDQVLGLIVDTYGLEDAEEYADDVLADYAADYDYSRIVAGDATIAIYGGSAPTDDSAAIVFVTMVDREYWES